MRRTDKKALLAVALAIAALTACNPAPKYVKPTAPSPVAYKESAPQEFKEGKGWRVAQPGDDKIRPKWWEMYNDPQLNALEERVAAGNQTIAASEANFRSARALVVSARSSLFPYRQHRALLFQFPHFVDSRCANRRARRIS